MKIIALVLSLILFGNVVFAYDFTITIPTEHIQRVKDALCTRWNYEREKLEEETEKEFIERTVKKRIKREVLMQERGIGLTLI